ncbi:hypothetical protein NHX12_000317 [Muraenolepis orangiensis]|uniref:Uncharacterized protein n=1 Tax=Muraenolepis orangiensis TaxID=630683 RepID=A0A9Q0I3Y5_9TELE|nr:hypothetical protein NHX12_000317 [Muraenolepis orangiensis]
MKALEIDVEELQELAESIGDRGHIGALKAKKSALADLLGISAQGALVRSRFRNISEMDASSRFFFGLECKNGQKRLIHSMCSDTGQILSESTDIRRHAVGFYSSLFQSELGEEQEVSHGFYESLPKVEQESSAELEAVSSILPCRAWKMGKLQRQSYWRTAAAELQEGSTHAVAKEGRLNGDQELEACLTFVYRVQAPLEGVSYLPG